MGSEVQDAAAAETRLKEVDVLHAADREREEESARASSLSHRRQVDQAVSDAALMICRNHCGYCTDCNGLLGLNLQTTCVGSGPAC